MGLPGDQETQRHRGDPGNQAATGTRAKADETFWTPSTYTIVEAGMKIEVEMRAFMDGAIRVVNIPDEELGPDPTEMAVLELVFKYGQNDFQPQQMTSVSVGDVVRYDGRRFEVYSTGFKEVS
jgi:hypothetical protein